MINNLELFLNKNIAALIASDIEFTPIGTLAIASGTRCNVSNWEFITKRSDNVEEKLYSLGFEKRYTDTEAFVDSTSVDQPCSIYVLDKTQYAKEIWVWNEVKRRYGKGFYHDKSVVHREELLAMLRELYDSKLLQTDLTHLPQGVDFLKEPTLTPVLIPQLREINVDTESSPTTVLGASSIASPVRGGGMTA